MLSNVPESVEPPSANPDVAPIVPLLEVRLVGAFEGWGLTTVARDHRPCWLGSELAAVLGVDPTVIEQLAGIVVIDGDDRRELLGRLDRAHVVLAPEARARPIVLVTLAGLDAIEAAIEQRIGRRLIRHLRERVVPEFQAHDRARRAGDRAINSLDAANTARNRLEFERRCFEAAAMERLLDRLARSGLVPTDLLTAHRLVASELAIGAGFDWSRESLTHGWSTPSQIATRFIGLTPSRVGSLLGELGLAGSRTHSRPYLSKARGHERTVVAHVYSPAAVALVERGLRNRGYQLRRFRHV